MSTLRKYVDVPSDDRLVCGNERLASTVCRDLDDGLANHVENRFGRAEVIAHSTTTHRPRAKPLAKVVVYEGSCTTQPLTERFDGIDKREIGSAAAVRVGIPWAMQLRNSRKRSC
jgi:hypothetical protein